MKTTLLITLLLLSLLATTALAQTYVNGYFKTDGTYVTGHFKTEANNTVLDNWSTKGNSNPITGQKGSVDPFRSTNSLGTSFGIESPAYGSSSKKSYDFNSDVKVNSYLRSTGTEVESYHRTKPNNTILDNYSTYPNRNPYTGKIGKKK